MALGTIWTTTERCLFVIRSRQDKAPKWDEDDDEWGVVEERTFSTMERQEFEKVRKSCSAENPNWLKNGE